MSKKWTDAQMAAINIKNKDLLVSAAAGSGKTATLTERIISSLTDKNAPADISRMLVVTFTRAAAAELRQRIFNALTAALAEDPTNKHLSSQLVKIGNAKISTIDSFYLELIRENFSTLGLPPTFRIADTAESELMAKDLMNDTVGEFYDRDTDGFSLFAEAFSGIRNSVKLPDVFLNLYSHVSSYPEGMDFLRRQAEECRAWAELDFFESSFGKILLENTREAVSHFIAVLDDAVAHIAADEAASAAYLPSFSYDLTFCRDLWELLEKGSYAAVRSHLLSYSPIKLKALKAEMTTEYIISLKDRRTSISKTIKALGARSFGLTHENISAAMKETATHVGRLFELLSSFDSKLSEEKLSRGICDFADIRRYAMKLLVLPDGSPTETARNLADNFTHIYIDEYQDVDRVQDMIFKSVSNGSNRFMVGDIKQSIYGFRGAEPQVFAEYRALFPAHGTDAAKDSLCEAIYMSNNFRCDENIIKFTNRVCSYLFGICAENIGYCPQDDLVFSKAKPTESYISPKVELSITVPPEDEDSEYDNKADNNRAAEARYIAAKIRELLGQRKADGSAIEPKDIAVLYRSGSMKKHLTEALGEAGIGFSGADDDKYFENPDVLLLLSLLSVIDNPHRDIQLAGALRSPLFGFTLDDLITLRNSRDHSHSLYDAVKAYPEENNDLLSEKCLDFLSSLNEWRDMTLSLPVDKLIKIIYASKKFSAAGLSNSENLRALYEYARRFESGSFRGLYNFIEYIGKIIEEGTKFETVADDSSPNKVSLMTIHHSKGLEFPVCFLCGVAGEFNRNDFKDSLLFEYSAGVAMKLPDGTGFARINTPMREAVAAKTLLNQTEEEMRVLYVAMTRARERLFVTASSSKSRQKLLDSAKERHAFADRYTLMKTKSYLEWILTAIADSNIEDICELKFLDAEALMNMSLSTNVAAPEIHSTESVDAAQAERLREDMAYTYPYLALSRLPSKISVSRLSPDVLDEGESALNLFDQTKKVAVPPILIGGNGQKASAAQRGTSTHLFLQFCNFSRAEKSGVIEELARLIHERFIPPNAENEVFADELEQFFESELYERIKNSKQIIREQRFNIQLPPSMFSKDNDFIKIAEKELLAVQGVIDLILIDANNDVHVYDYKTDRLSQAELRDEEKLSAKMRALHSEQLSYYKLAVERLWGKKCASVQVYSTHAAKLVNIDI